MARSRTILPQENRCLAASVKEFADRPMSLVDRDIGVSARAGIGVGNGDIAEGPAADDPGFFFFGLPLRIKKRVRRIGVTMRPAIDSNRFNVTGRVKSCASEHAVQLIPYVALEFLKGCPHQFDAAGTELIAHRES